MALWKIVGALALMAILAAGVVLFAYNNFDETADGDRITSEADVRNEKFG